MNTPALTMEERQRLHLLSLHLDSDEMAAYQAKFEEVRARWAKMYGAKAGSEKPATSDEGKRERLAWSGEGRDPKSKAKPWQWFEREWQLGQATIAGLVEQIDSINDILDKRREPQIEALKVRPVTHQIRAHGEQLGALGAKVEELRAKGAEVEELRAKVASFDAERAGWLARLADLERTVNGPTTKPPPPSPNGQPGAQPAQPAQP